ncbi:MAG: HU family DNA-binding protein [Luminiphilus sp.]|jgi:nucleoid DNA-binding protein|tara:strand:+ start:546 stop:917 length:372 start_codon:yes stop_codon:yes gene_type:complete
MGKKQTGKQLEKAVEAKKMKPVKTKLSKSQMFEALAEDSGVTKSEVKKVWGSLERLIEASICERGYGQFTLPGLMKVTTVRRPAIKARRGINPFTKEEIWFKAKPATTGVRIRALKKMKGFAN